MKPFKQLPPAEELRAAFSYDPETGELLRRGKPCGWEQGTGYRCVTIGTRITKQHYLVHRLIWKLVTGNDPGQMEVDHINRNRSDNRWCNLRLVSHSQNQNNAKKRSVSNQPYKGICQHQGKNRWAARICIDGKRIGLGTFDTPEEAHQAYLQAQDAALNDEPSSF